MTKKTFLIIAGILVGIILLRLAYMYLNRTPKPATNTSNTGSSTATNSNAAAGNTSQPATGTTLADVLFTGDMNAFIAKIQSTKLI